MEMKPEDDDKPAAQGMVREVVEDAVRRMSGMIQSAFKPLTEKIAMMDAKIDEHSNALARLSAKTDAHHRDTIGTIQAFVGKLESYERETYTIPATLDKHGKRLDDHEARLRKLGS